MFKKIMSCLMAGAIVACSGILGVSAEEIKKSIPMQTQIYGDEYVTVPAVDSIKGPYGGGEQKEFKTIQQQMQEYLARNDKSLKEKQNAIEHFKKLEALQNGTFVNTKNTRSTYGYLSVNVYRQEEPYYCGPATLKQTEDFFNNSSSSQSTIANIVGTTTDGTELSEMKEYLNDNTTNAYADLWWYANQDAFIDTIISSIDSDVPPVLHMSSSSSDVGYNKWLYTTSGHYMNIRGYTSSGDRIAVADPYGYEGGGIESGKYYVSDDVLYDTMTYLIV